LIPIEIDCDGCAHCVDLKAATPEDHPNLTKARNQITDVLEMWIKIEQKSRHMTFVEKEKALDVVSYEFLA
jgi:hypothetical protein